MSKRNGRTAQRRRRSEAERAYQRGNLSARDSQQVLGSPGLSMWNGVVGEEYLSQLKPWSREARVYLEMRNDPMIHTLLNAIKLPLLSAPVSVEPASDNARDQAAADFISENMEQMYAQSWTAHIEDALSCLDFGFSFGELVFEKRDDGRLWLRNIEPRGQETLRRWAVAGEDEDEVVGFVQGHFRGSRVGEETLIPLEKALHITYQGRKGNPMGRSLLRPLFRAYTFKVNLENFEGIGVERDVGGVPVMTLPEHPPNEDELEDIQNQLRDLRNDEEAYVMIPNGATLQGYSGGAKVYNVREIIRDWEKIILGTMFAQFLKLGMEQTGTQALVKGSHDFFSLGLQSVQRFVVEAWNQQLVPTMLALNPSLQTGDPPRVRWAPPGKEDVSDVLDIFQKGVTSRVLTPTRQDEEMLRDRVELPELEDDQGQQDRTASPTAGIPGGFRADRVMLEQARVYALGDDPDLRTGGGTWEQFANRYQREIVDTYAAWSKETARLASLEGRTASQVQDMVRGRLDDLSEQLKQLSRSRVNEAAVLGLGDRLAHQAESPQVQQAIARMIRQSEIAIESSLIPDIRARFLQDLPNKLQIGDQSRRLAQFTGALEARQARAASHAGGAWVAMFETQAQGGMAENRERRARGEPVIPVKWELDPTADHCEDDRLRGTFGCPGLARVYSGGWDEMPTVPAANTSCALNDRCTLLADFGNGWERA